MDVVTAALARRRALRLPQDSQPVGFADSQFAANGKYFQCNRVGNPLPRLEGPIHEIRPEQINRQFWIASIHAFDDATNAIFGRVLRGSPCENNDS